MVLTSAARPGIDGPPCGPLSGRTDRGLLLSLRHLGDAVIAAGFVQALRKQNPAMPVNVLGLPQHEEVFRSLCRIDRYFRIDLPLFRHHRRSEASMAAALRTLRAVRRSRHRFCINLIGDVRENLIGRLSGATWNIAPTWAPGHLFRNKITGKLSFPAANCAIPIPAEYRSYYDSLRFFAARLGLERLSSPTPSRVSASAQPGHRLLVALHPGASHPSRRWPAAKWKSLITALSARGCRLLLIGAPDEEPALRSEYGEEIDRFRIDVVATGLQGFFSALSAADALVGMDSLSAHAAHILGVPSVVLNGSADFVIMTPPGSAAVSAGHLCPQFPCYYRFPCTGTANEFVCCRGIEVEEVLHSLDRLLRAPPPAAN